MRSLVTKARLKRVLYDLVEYNVYFFIGPFRANELCPHTRGAEQNRTRRDRRKRRHRTNTPAIGPHQIARTPFLQPSFEGPRNSETKAKRLSEFLFRILAFDIPCMYIYIITFNEILQLLPPIFTLGCIKCSW